MKDVDVAARLVTGVAALARGALGAASEKGEGVVGKGSGAGDGTAAGMLVARIEQQGALAVHDEIAHAADPRPERGARQRRRLDEDVREAVVV
jgi:hypothetical protein